MAASAHLKTQTQTKPKRRKQHREITISTSASPSSPRSPTPDQSMATAPSSPVPTYPPSYANFNSALTAGLLNPMSPPPPLDKTRSSPALFDMMSHEPNPNPNPNPTRPVPTDRQLLLQQRIAEILDGDGLFNDQESSDVRLTLTAKDSLTFSLNLHRPVLASNSRFFAMRIPDRRSKHHLVEISDCDDIEIYVETLSLMYCNDLRRRLMKADVGRVLEILKVSAAIAFDAGVVSCLEHLEAAPWAEDEEEKVASLLSQLNLDLAGAGAGEVLKRVSLEVATSSEEAIVTRLIKVVLEGKDEKARREMKGLMAKMLRVNSRGSGDILSEESLYSACNCCIQQLHHHFASASDASDSAPQISRQADNLHWILDILIDQRIADEFLRIWAAQTELAELHSNLPALHRYEVSRVTARLFIAIGQGQILVCRETRCLLLRTWLEPFYEDFGWMRRSFKGIDRHSIEDGLGSTILTLPMRMQQEILMDWFHRFLNSGDDCPNIERGFEVWWRRAFWRKSGEREQPPQLRIAAACDNSC